MKQALAGYVVAPCVALSATACSFPLGPRPPVASVVALPTEDAPSRPPCAANHVKVAVGRVPSGSYDVLGVVAVRAYRGDDPLALLRAAGAQLGADVVTDVRMAPTRDATALSGVAWGVRRVEPSPD